MMTSVILVAGRADATDGGRVRSDTAPCPKRSTAPIRERDNEIHGKHSAGALFYSGVCAGMAGPAVAAARDGGSLSGPFRGRAGAQQPGVPRTGEGHPGADAGGGPRRSR